MVERHAPQVNDLVKTRINELRLDARDLAERVGVSHPTVYNWKNGTSEVPFHLWPAIERELGLRFGTLAEVAGVHPGREDVTVAPLKPYETVLNELEAATRRVVELLRDPPDA